jgi:hypothetical protein
MGVIDSSLGLLAKTATKKEEIGQSKKISTSLK